MLRFLMATLCVLALTACDTDSPTDAGRRDSGRVDSGRRDAGGRDAGPRDSGPADAGPQDAGMDAGPPDAGPPPFDGGPTTQDASIGATCVSNFDCAATQFCACTEVSGCACQIGDRGTSPTGTACTMNSDCASGICLEDNGVEACTRPCAPEMEDAPGCGGLFPACRAIPFLGQLCAAADVDGGV